MKEDERKIYQKIMEQVEEENPEDPLNGIKAEAAFGLGLEVDSDEWYELMDI